MDAKEAIDGIFEPECDRWVQYNTTQEKISIRWWEDNDRLYQVARKLPGSKFYSPTKSVLVGVAHYKLIEEFAELYQFKFSKKAEEVIKAEKNKIKTVVEPKNTTPEKRTVDGLKEILNSSSEILDDLKD